MRPTLLLALPALQEVLSEDFRRIKYSLFPPLSLLTLASMTPPDRYRMFVKDEHVEPLGIYDGIDLVAMTVYVSSADRAWEIADAYRRRGTKVVVGGIHPSTLPEEAARHADAVCIGPAESVWPRILRDFERGALRKFYRGSCPGSAALAPPARRDLMNPCAYLITQTLVTSRGCPHACDFCYKTSFWGRKYFEPRPLRSVAGELSSFGSKFVFFLDDNFTANKGRAREVFRLLRERGMIWQASASLEVAKHAAFLDEAYASGCRSLFVGFESLSKENMRRHHKPANATAEYAEAVRRFHDAGIMINGSFMFGFDGDGPDVFDRTLEFAVENKIETATFHILTPYPGTRFFAQMRGEGRLLHRDWKRYDTRHAVFRPARMTPAELEEGYRRSYEEFYAVRSILRRSFGLPGRMKRIAYNVGWKRMDRLWSFAIRCGLLPFLRPVFEKILARNTRREPETHFPPGGRFLRNRLREPHRKKPVRCRRDVCGPSASNATAKR